MPTAEQWAALDRWEDRRRRRFLRETTKRLGAALRNEAGYDRLRAVSDEEWRAEVEEGEMESAP